MSHARPGSRSPSRIVAAAIPWLAMLIVAFLARVVQPVILSDSQASNDSPWSPPSRSRFPYTPRSSRRCRRGRLNSRIDDHSSFSHRSLLASSPSDSSSLTFRIPAVPRASPPHCPHDRLAAAALKECAAEWGMSATGWARGAECAQAQAITCDGDGMVTSLDVAQRNLTGSLPFALSALSRLHSLNVRSNQLSGPLPPALSTLARLRTL
ncbi:unnamed protein product, partial [Closterium sp. NIES-64]